MASRRSSLLFSMLSSALLLLLLQCSHVVLADTTATSTLQSFAAPLTNGTCRSFDATSSTSFRYSQCGAVVTWSRVFVPRGVSFAELDLAAYLQTQQYLYATVSESCSAAALRQVCTALYPPCYSYSAYPFDSNSGTYLPDLIKVTVGVPSCPELCHTALHACAHADSRYQYVTQPFQCVGSYYDTLPRSSNQSTIDDDAVPQWNAPVVAPVIDIPICQTAKRTLKLYNPTATNVHHDACVLQCPNPQFTHGEIRAGQMLLMSTGIISIVLTALGISCLLAHPQYRSFPRSAALYSLVVDHMSSWAFTVYLFHIGSIDGVICIDGRAATITHAPCGFQGVVIVFSSYAWILWYDVLAVILAFRVFKKHRWLGSMRRLHIVSHLGIWPVSVIMTFIVAGLGIESDGTLSCTASFSRWSGYMQDALFAIPITVLTLIGVILLAVVAVRVTLLSAQKRLGSVASTRLFLWAMWGILVVLFNDAYYFQLRGREGGIQHNEQQWIRCSAEHPLDYAEQCSLQGDRLNFSVALLDLMLDASMPTIGFVILLSKRRIWAQWVYYVRYYVLRDKTAVDPFYNTEWYKQKQARKQAKRRELDGLAAANDEEQPAIGPPPSRPAPPPPPPPEAQVPES